MNVRQTLAACVLATIVHSATFAAEPNETFGTSTTLAAGVLSVSDELYAGVSGEPDTVLGARGPSGGYTDFDDNSSHLGNGYASRLLGVPTNSGTIDFSISGYPDQFFEGSHGQQGGYELVVQAFDFSGELDETFTERHTLFPGEVLDFFVNSSNWIGGYYNVYIDNTVGSPGDIDFFTFTGLTPGESFTAETFVPSLSGIDTVLVWFDSAGTFLAENDDVSDEVLTSQLQGTVPNDGALTFAVTGFGDDAYNGQHNQSGAYELQLSLGGGGLAGDFNGDNQVNAGDLTAWKQSFGAASDGADADGDGDSDGADFLVWQRHLGTSAATGAAAVPEPGAGAVALAAAVGIVSLWRRSCASATAG